MNFSREQADAVMVALLKASILMRLPPATICAVLQTGLEDIYLIRTGEDFLELHLEAIERARRFVRLWDQLNVIHKQDSESACAWMNAPCLDLDGRRPVDVLAEREGLDRVANQVQRRYETLRADRPAPGSRP